jgi:oligoendopeptidase F
VVKVDKTYAIEWAYIPHFYYDYYVFNYVGGYLNGLELSEKALSDSKSRDKYLNMLQAGSSERPLDLLKQAGLDAISPTAYDDAFNVMEKRLAELEKIVGK